MNGKPHVMIMHAPGTNRDREAALAIEISGGVPEIVHINQLINGQRRLLDYQMLVIPGGFSYGDDLGAGKLWANELLRRLREDLDIFVEAGKPVIGICNGFQVLVKAGYLPGPPPDQRVTLTFNRRRHFECRWVRLRPNLESPCLFVRGLQEDILCPVAHGEGRLAVADQETRHMLRTQRLDVLHYVQVRDPAEADNPSCEVAIEKAASYPYNPNGSVDDIAGICNARGNVLGLMPHPEDHIIPLQHPRWLRGKSGGMGLPLFRNGVRAAAQF